MSHEEQKSRGSGLVIVCIHRSRVIAHILFVFFSRAVI